MKFAIQCLEEKRNELVQGIKNGNASLINEKVEVEQAICWLQKIVQLQLGKFGYCKFIRLPDMQTGYSEYHVMNDCESGNVDDWIELKDAQNYPVTLIQGDYLLSIRP